MRMTQYRPRTSAKDRAQVLLEAVELAGPGDRDDPRPLREQPRERDLAGRGTHTAADRAQQLDEAQVRVPGAPCLRGERSGSRRSRR